MTTTVHIDSMLVWQWIRDMSIYMIDIDVERLSQMYPEREVIECVIAFCGGQRADIRSAKRIARDLVQVYGKNLVPYVENRSSNPIYLWDDREIAVNVAMFIKDCRELLESHVL
jgi:hypothetical protein